MPARGREGVSRGPPFESRAVYILSATERGGQGDPTLRQRNQMEGTAT